MFFVNIFWTSLNFVNKNISFKNKNFSIIKVVKLTYKLILVKYGEKWLDIFYFSTLEVSTNIRNLVFLSFEIFLTVIILQEVLISKLCYTFFVGPW